MESNAMEKVNLQVEKDSHFSKDNDGLNIAKESIEVVKSLTIESELKGINNNLSQEDLSKTENADTNENIIIENNQNNDPKAKPKKTNKYVIISIIIFLVIALSCSTLIITIKNLKGDQYVYKKAVEIEGRLFQIEIKHKEKENDNYIDRVEVKSQDNKCITEILTNNEEKKEYSDIECDGEHLIIDNTNKNIDSEIEFKNEDLSSLEEFPEKAIGTNRILRSENWSYPSGCGIVNCNKKIHYVRVCYPRCRKWRCSKHCNDIVLWTFTLCECDRFCPSCRCTNNKCECGKSGHSCPNLYFAQDPCNTSIAGCGAKCLCSNTP